MKTNINQVSAHHGHAEIGELTANYNHMADTVQCNIEEFQKEGKLKKTFPRSAPLLVMKGKDIM